MHRLTHQRLGLGLGLAPPEDWYVPEGLDLALGLEQKVRNIRNNGKNQKERYLELGLLGPSSALSLGQIHLLDNTLEHGWLGGGFAHQGSLGLQ